MGKHEMYLFVDKYHCHSLKCSCGRIIHGGSKTGQAELIGDHTAEIEEGTAVR